MGGCSRRAGGMGGRGVCRSHQRDGGGACVGAAIARSTRGRSGGSCGWRSDWGEGGVVGGGWWLEEGGADMVSAVVSLSASRRARESRRSLSAEMGNAGRDPLTQTDSQSATLSADRDRQTDSCILLLIPTRSLLTPPLHPPTNSNNAPRPAQHQRPARRLQRRRIVPRVCPQLPHLHHSLALHPVHDAADQVGGPRTALQGRAPGFRPVRLGNTRARCQRDLLPRRVDLVE